MSVSREFDWGAVHLSYRLPKKNTMTEFPMRNVSNSSAESDRFQCGNRSDPVRKRIDSSAEFDLIQCGNLEFTCSGRNSCADGKNSHN
jgi:hypothetical protein